MVVDEKVVGQNKTEKWWIRPHSVHAATTPLTLSLTLQQARRLWHLEPLTGVRRRLQVYVTPYDAGITSAATDSVMVTCTVCPGFSVRRNFCISGVFASTI